MEDYRKEIESSLYLIDNKPNENFDGLSRSEMRYLIYNPFSRDSPFQINRNFSSRILSQIPLLKPVLFLLKKASEIKYIKLTKQGYLPPVLVKQIDDTVLVRGSYLIISSVRLSAEISSIEVHMVREISELCGFLINKNNKLFLSPKWKEHLLKNNLDIIFRYLFMGFTKHYPWTKIGFPSNPNTGQTGFAYTLYLLYKYGRSFKPISFYIDKYVKAFPFTSEELMPIEYSSYPEPRTIPQSDSFPSSFETNTFYRFLVNFNLVDYQWVQKPFFERQLMIKKSKIFNKIVNFKD